MNHSSGVCLLVMQLPAADPFFKQSSGDNQGQISICSCRETSTVIIYTGFAKEQDMFKKLRRIAAVKLGGSLVDYLAPGCIPLRSG